MHLALHPDPCRPDTSWMDAPGATRIKRLRRNLKLTGAIVLLSVGVLLPVLLSTFVNT